MAVYQFKELTFTYPMQAKPALDNVSFCLYEGEFVTLCGKSGCGKSTLLRHMKTVLTPHGTRTGQVLFQGKPLEDWDQRAQTSAIGFVLQSPDNQIVTDKVWHELAFGLESLGCSTPEIRLRVAEMASFFGIQTWFYKSVTELSGGQKQILNLASIMAMQPSVLILDEPTSQLDPIAAGDFLAAIGRINRELGTTIILSEQRLEAVFPMSDRVAVMDSGRLIALDTPHNIGHELKHTNNEMFLAMPSAMQIHARIPNDLPCPVTVRDGRRWLNNLLDAPNTEFSLLSTTAKDGKHGESQEPASPSTAFDVKNDNTNCCSPAGLVSKLFPVSVRKMKKGYSQPPAVPVIECKDAWFKYEKGSPDVIKGLSLTVDKGDFYAIVGGNGTGKTTALSIMAGVLRPYRGKVMLNGKDIFKTPNNELFTNNIGMLPQDPQSLFVKRTVELDLMEMLDGHKLAKEQKREKARQIAGLVQITHLLSMHPYDLSGGEQQRAALAKVLLLEPRILLLDEPTKGMDGCFKQEFAEILNDLLAKGTTIVMVSHDIEFCAKYAGRCALFFDGYIISENTPGKFFTGNTFYTTAANRIARHVFSDAVTVDDVVAEVRLRQSQVPGIEPNQDEPEQSTVVPNQIQQNQQTQPSRIESNRSEKGM